MHYQVVAMPFLEVYMVSPEELWRRRHFTRHPGGDRWSCWGPSRFTGRPSIHSLHRSFTIRCY